MEKLEKIINKYILLILVFFSIPAIWALFVPGYFGASDDLHIAWLYQMHKTLMMGQIPPRFVPDLSFGFGYPLFNFVFPLPFYLGEVFHLLGLSFVSSIKAVFLISIPLSGIFMYMLLRQFASSSLSLVGALLYIYTPYRAVDLYIRGAIGEIVSFIFLPLIILSVIKISQDKGIKWVGIGALALASLVLSHNITAYMFFPFVGLLLIIQFFLNSRKKVFIFKSLSMILLGFLVSIYFWLPALLDSGLMKYDTVFNFVDHFPTLRQLITPYWGYGGSVPGPGDGMSFFLGGVNLLILISGGVLFLSRWKKLDNQKRLLVWWALSAILAALLLMNHRSSFLWSNLPMLPYFQFPWRFLILTTFFTPLLVIAFEGIKFKRYLVIMVPLIILPAITYFRPQDFLGRQDEYYLNRYIPYPSASEEYKKTQEEYLRLPRNTKVRPDKNYPRVSNGNVNISEALKSNDLDMVFKVTSDQGGSMNYNKYFFPGWTARIDNKAINISAGEPFGQITFFVPAGTHIVEVSFEETTLKKALDAISLVSFLVSLGLTKNLWSLSRKTGRS
jgi:hypothetical protein